MPLSETQSRGSARRVRIAFRSGCCRSFGRIWPLVAMSRCRLPSLPVGPGTPKESTSRVSRSRWSIGWQTLQQIAARQRENPLAFVENRELFGDLATEPAFTEPYLNALNSLHSRGARATLETSPGVHLPSSRIADQRN